MSKPVLTWLDLDGRIRITSPCYNDLAHPNRTEAEWIALARAEIIANYGLPANHVIHQVENEDMSAALKAIGGSHFRWGGKRRPDRKGRTDRDGNPIMTRDGLDGAWELDSNGVPQVNMAKARVVHQDAIEQAAADLGVPVPTVDVSRARTPVTLKRIWPTELDARKPQE